MTVNRGIAVVGTILGIAAGALAGDGLALRSHADAGVLEAVDRGGSVVWRADFDQARAPKVLHWDGTSAVLGNGMVIDAHGRLLARTAPGDAVIDGLCERGEARGVAWDVPVPLAPPASGFSDAHLPPVFDSAGTAWVFNTHIQSGDYELQLWRSNGHDGTWGPTEVVVDPSGYVGAPDHVMDANDVITVAYRDIAGGYRLYTMRYTPGSGWAGPNQIYATSRFWQAIEVGADQFGNVVIVIDEEGPSLEERVMSMVRDATTGTWSSLTQISGAGLNCRLPTIFHNPAGDTMYLVYMVTNPGSRRLYAHEWDAATKTWGPATPIPGTEITTYSFSSASVVWPGGVDAAGNVTVFWESYDDPKDVYTSYGNRCEAGVWQSPHLVLPEHPDSVDMENFAGVSVNAAGDVVGVATQSEYDGVFHNRLHCFHFNADDGWLATVNPYESDLNTSVRSRVQFYGGGRAVATFQSRQDGQRQTSSLLYDGTSWDPNLVDIPGTEFAYYQDLAADAGEPLLVYEGEGGGNQGIKATFLRTHIVGDMDCNGVIEFADINPFVVAVVEGQAAYQTQYPSCDYLNADCDGNGSVGFEDINPFVVLVVGS